MDFKDKLRELRKKQNITQEALANKICVSRTLISKYESGAVIPTEENLKLLAEYFQISTNELMTSEDGLSLALKNYNMYKVLKVSVSIFITILSISFILLMILPIFKYEHQEIVDGVNKGYVYGMVSILTACFKENNPLGLISIIFSMVSLIFSILILVNKTDKNFKIIQIAVVVLFAITIVFFIFTLIFGLQMINSNDFSLNSHK